MKKTVIFGAGQIGRGFIGDICAASGYRMVFVDAFGKLVELLNERGEYPLWILSGEKKEKMIGNFSALKISETEKIGEEISQCDIIFTAVGANNLVSLAPFIAAGIEKKFSSGRDSFLNVVICENLLGGAEVLRDAVRKRLGSFLGNRFDDKVGFVETVVSRMVAPVPDELRNSEPLLVTVEPYDVLPVSATSFRGGIPDMRGFYPVRDIHPYEELKLFVHNLAHATLAYSGFLSGHTFIWECMEDNNIVGLLKGVVGETRRAIISKHGLDSREVGDYATDLFSRFRNRALKDTVARVARDPMRKLGKNERLAGAIKICLGQDVFPENICFATAACLCYNNRDDEGSIALQKILKERGVDYLLKNISCIKNSEVIKKIKNNYREIKK